MSGRSCLDAMCELGVLEPVERHTAEAVCRLSGDDDEDVRLAVALATRAVRHGHVCLDLRRLGDQGLTDDEGANVDVELPALDGWIATLSASGCIRGPRDDRSAPLVLDGDLLYLDRYWRYEQRLADGLLAAAETLDDRDPEWVEGVLDRLFDEQPGAIDQRRAAELATRRRLTVLTGGPGTGKTTTVVRMLAALAATASSDVPPRMVLAAPTGKAAARMAEAIRADVDTLDVPDAVKDVVRGVDSSTLHRLLGWSPGRPTRFGHDLSRPLEHDVVVVDEASMVSLPLMAKLVDALGDSTRLVLVGDREQLVSIDAGAVLADLAAGGGLDDDVVHLTHTFRFGAGSGILEVARAIERGDAEAVIGLLDGRFDDMRLIEPTASGELPADVRARIVEQGSRLRDLARSSVDSGEVLAAVDRFRVLAPLRRGPHGVDTLNTLLARWLDDDRGGVHGGHPVGTPVIVTRNDHARRLYNGDVGVVVADDHAAGGAAVAFWAPGGGTRRLAPSRLPLHEPVHAMSVHKSQGSQFDEVVVALPSVDTPLLTRELVYTAITRARRHVTVVADPAILRAALTRRVQRASGLRKRLRSAV